MPLYAATKLCNLLTARSLVSINAKENRNIAIIAYNPGLTGDTSLMGQQSAILKLLLPVIIRPIFYVISMIKPAFFMGTAIRSGEALAGLALGKVPLPMNRIYASLVRGEITFPNPSLLAQDNSTRDLLWKESAQMVGLPHGNN